MSSPKTAKSKVSGYDSELTEGEAKLKHVKNINLYINQYLMFDGCINMNLGVW